MCVCFKADVCRWTTNLSVCVFLTATEYRQPSLIVELREVVLLWKHKRKGVCLAILAGRPELRWECVGWERYAWNSCLNSSSHSDVRGWHGAVAAEATS